jgi:hypothetical protein
LAHRMAPFELNEAEGGGGGGGGPPLAVWQQRRSVQRRLEHSLQNHYVKPVLKNTTRPLSVPLSHVTVTVTVKDNSVSP